MISLSVSVTEKSVIYSMSQKIPPGDLWQFFQNCWEFFNQILRTYYAFVSTLDDEFLLTYLQLWRSYAILSVTTQFTSCAQNVHHRPKRIFWHFPKRLGIFSPNFTCLLYVPIYAGVQIFIQLSATLTNLCHIKRDHHKCAVLKMSTIDRNAAGWSHLIWHNFVKVGDNWTKICILVYVWIIIIIIIKFFNVA